ncbi:hypothetical protein MSP8887_00590 [Marinomonas spartinae]|uniref:Uncharacterized protein n=1 Tax=Marinomonas spartinae TaxID=1792290 RepID=A0A1A8TB17_9GAMM|nr:hypothetical protein [Marinomonas spartinae]SBS27256.1 hypothetical protein MSP8887_00590 [Marinomonas spartinae]SBS28975.1 hypothetical protein MSP8886_01386 [Marinomonas spartinae]
MAITLRNYNIVRVIDNGVIVNCTVINMFYDYVTVKFKGQEYKVPYHLIDEVVGHELLIPA